MNIVSKLSRVHFGTYINSGSELICCVSLHAGCKCHIDVEYCSVSERYSAHGLCFVHALYV